MARTKAGQDRSVVEALQQSLEDHRRELAWLGVGFSCLFATVALAGWRPHDRTWWRPDLRALPVENPCGPLGANLADAMYLLAGYGAWAVVGGIVVSVLGVAGRPLPRLSRAALLGWTWLVALGLLELALGPDGVVAHRPGGWLGEALAVGLSAVVGWLGAWLVLLAAAVSALGLVFGVRWRELAWHLLARWDAARPHLERGARGVGAWAWHVARVGAAWAGRWTWFALDRLGAWFRRLCWRASLAAWAGVLQLAASGRLAVRRMWASLTDGELPTVTPDTWTASTGLERLAPSDADMGALVDLALGAPGVDGPTRVSEPARLAEARWDTTVTEAPAAVLGRFPDLAPRAPDPPAVAVVEIDEDPPASWGARREVKRPAPAVTVAPPASPPARRVDAAPAQPAWSAEPDDDELDDDELPGGEDARAYRASVADTDPDLDDDPSLSDEEEDSLIRPAAPVGARSASPLASVSLRSDVQVAAAEALDRHIRDDGRAVSDQPDLFFELPPLSLLDEVPVQRATVDEEALRELATTVEESLASFKVTGKVTNVRVGPVVTTFEFLPDTGISVRKINALQDDLAMALRALSVRVVAPIPGKGVVGIEIPSKQRMTIFLRELLASPEFRNDNGALPVILGKDVEGRPMVMDLARMPHLLVGGTTGSGKSVGVNGMLMSLLFRKTPEELRMLLVDPKKLEFEAYADVPHLLHPVVTEPKYAAAALAWACREMDRRYELLARWGTRNIANYNKKVEREMRNWTPAKARQYAPKDLPDEVPAPRPELLPYIVIVIDELADLMIVAKKEVEGSIVRLAQMARACGMHLIIATQRPSVDVVTGLIKSNLPTRVSFKLRSVIDSRTILDAGGAEKLLGQGDQLVLPGSGDIMRAHGPFVSDDEVLRVIEFLKAQRAPEYIEAVIADAGEDDPEVALEDQDELFDEAVAIVLKHGRASTSMIQRQLKIGYNRAARIVDMMEAAGIVGPADGARPREVIGGGP